jgi:hypothetical protein
MSLLFCAYGKFDTASSLLIVCPNKNHYYKPNVTGSEESTLLVYWVFGVCLI